MVNREILKMLRSLSIDYLGISLDSLLIFTPEAEAGVILKAVRDLGVQIGRVGEVFEEPRKAQLSYHGKLIDLKPKFREAAYTEVKKLVGEDASTDESELKRIVMEAYRHTKEKQEMALKLIRGLSYRAEE